MSCASACAFAAFFEATSAVEHLAGEPHELLAFAHLVADIDVHRGDAIAADFGTDDGFLPRVDAAGGDHGARELLGARRGDADGERTVALLGLRWAPERHAHIDRRQSDGLSRAAETTRSYVKMRMGA